MINIKELRESIDMTQEQFALQIGTTVRTIQNWEAGKVIPKSKIDIIKRIVNENSKDGFDDREEEVSSRYITYEVPIAAIGGGLIGFDGEGVRREDCERIISPIADVDWCIPVYGDSMEPEYPNGSKVFVRQINPRDFIPWGNVFVLDTTNGLILKMVVKSDKKDCVRCESLNPSGRYAPFDVPMRTIRAMYRVLACVALK